MSEKIRKAQTGEHTGNPGEFGSVNRPESPVVLRERTLSGLDNDIAEVCADAGLGGVMPGVLGVIHDRGADESDRWDDIIGDLSAEDVQDGYFDRIAPAIDPISYELEAAAADAEPSGASAEETEAHINAICTQAGYEGVMPGIIDVVLERAESSPVMRKVIGGLTPADIGRYYEQHVGPAIDNWCDHLGSWFCDDCGVPIDAEAGSDCPFCS